jgi:hypothetical protein
MLEVCRFISPSVSLSSLHKGLIIFLVGALVKNDNAEAVQRAVQEQREKSKQEYQKKKDKDKQDRELQKQKEKDRKETEKKRTQKGERRR